MWARPPGSFCQHETLDHPNTIGVHSNEWSILLGYDITLTKRYMSPRGWDSHIYDAGHTSRIIPLKRNVGPPKHDWGPFYDICLLLPDVTVNRVEPLVDQNDYGVKRCASLTDVTCQSK